MLGAPRAVIDMPMRCFFATLGTETNSFSPIPTGWSVWRDTLYRSRRDGLPTVHAGQRAFAELFARVQARNWSLECGLQAFAAPSGPTPSPVFTALADELLEDLANVGDVDAVLLHLHGAMISDDEDDCESALVERVRSRVGTGCPIGVLLDPHCHLGPRLLRATPLVFGYREYPHVDAHARLVALFEALADTAEGTITPVAALVDCPLLAMYPTTSPAMRELVSRYEAASSAPGIVDAWFAHGFPWGDVEALGARVLAIADGDAALARETALELERETFAAREAIAMAPMNLEAVLDEATRDTAGPVGPVVIADSADNTGGGAPGDSTFFLRALLDRQVAGAAIAPIFDPGAVTLCRDAGVGARLRLRVGGKLAAESGDPVDVDAEVLTERESLGQMLNGAPARLGPSVAVRASVPGAPPVHLVLTSRRVQAGSPELFTELGLEPTHFELLVLKSSQHFHAGFAPLASRVLYCGSPGALSGDVSRIPYRRAPASRLWPLCAEPETGGVLFG